MSERMACAACGVPLQDHDDDLCERCDAKFEEERHTAAYREMREEHRPRVRRYADEPNDTDQESPFD